jgi:hypothetical protein
MAAPRILYLASGVMAINNEPWDLGVWNFV